MKVIFLDVDGVLNYSKFDSEYLRNFRYNYDNDVLSVDPKKVEILAKICHKYNASVVLSSSWKLGIEPTSISKGLQDLTWLFLENGIDFLGCTPNIPNFSKGGGQEMWKEWDIECYLYEHPEVDGYCIIDDEIYDLETKKDRLVQTQYIVDEEGNGGLMPYQEEEIGMKLAKKMK